MPLYNLLSILTSIISNTSNATQPVIVLGDFNEDVINNQNSSLLSLMSTGGFNQMVNSPTTDRGTLIDLVFICVEMEVLVGKGLKKCICVEMEVEVGKGLKYVFVWRRR